MKILISFLPYFLSGAFWVKNSAPPSPLLPIEICDNGIDDDEDGLIDLNDPDCDCPVALPQSLIPNPSFEERTCCPQDRSQLFCATNWIQASEPTTDYLHTCGWMGWPDLPPPLPFPDGNGCVGFRNGRVGNSSGPGGPSVNNPNWKEYAGACLLNPLKAGTAYRFEFWVGFTKAFNSPPTTIVFYGSPDCGNLPFGINNNEFGCPTNGPGWVELGAVPISGALQWKLMEINVTPLQDLYAIAIGPNCNEEAQVTNTYYFFDNLVLADVQQFEFKISATGNPCGSDFALNLPDRDTLQYQWYRNGVALVGETGPSLQGIADEEGEYQVRVLGPNSCRVTPAYKLKIPFFTTFLDTLICFGDAVFFDKTLLDKEGEYVDTLQSYFGCDSIVHLRLQVTQEEADTVYAKIFANETYRLGNRGYKNPGEYDAVFASQNGCDSLVHLVLDFYDIYIPNALSPNGDGVNDVFTIFAGPDIKEVFNLEIYDRWGARVFERNSLTPNDAQMGWDGTHLGKPASLGVYVWQATIIFDDGKKRELTGSVTLLR